MKRYIQQLPVYLLGFMLFWEWLRPLEIVTDTDNTEWFLTFAIVSFLLYFLEIPAVVSIGIRFLTMMYILNVLFFPGSFLKLTWLSPLLQDLKANMSLLTEMQWLALTNSFRTFLFFVLLWLMSYLTYYWLIQAKKIFLFFLLTVIYIGVLDTFTGYDGSFAMVRTILVGLFVMGILYMLRLKHEERIQIPVFWALPLILLAFSAAGFAYVMPKAAPQWPDPVPFIKKTASGDPSSGNAGVKKIGYGTNDEHLGGPFIMDDTTVFTAETEEQHYWRVESKSFYTGKGWKAPSQANLQRTSPDTPGVGQFDASVPVESVRAKVKMSPSFSYPHVVYAPELQQILSDKNVDYYVNPFTEKILTRNDEQPVALNEYKLQYEYPKFKTTKLEGVEAEHPDARYTQVPESLPKRVKDLALEITKDEQTDYEKAKAIERYFSQNGYIYETKDVAVPGEDEDYVDQFLFESKKGYCDNFSSSMAVMLRSLDIPTRWVKGYTQGDYVENVKPGVQLYKVTNANAHSWVEVYFPETGWVPFEPTKGFNNPYNFSSDSQASDQSVELPESEQQEAQQQEQQQEQEEQQTGSKGSGAWLPIILSIIVVVLLAAGLYLTRRKWMKFILLRKYRHFHNEQEFINGYLALLKHLNRNGFQRHTSQTLRAYGEEVDRKLQTSEMHQLTAQYEQLLYGNNTEQISFQHGYELWENLIKKISS
ncbi:transglutaminaseTgpA domain-containing protein [Bacillus tianshenii]|nr:transglutaminaseTgpA domain-containing protein [Bacillus tianshenii]